MSLVFFLPYAPRILVGPIWPTQETSTGVIGKHSCDIQEYILSFVFVFFSKHPLRIPGGLIGVLGQAALVFSVLFARLFLGTKFDMLQKCGVRFILDFPRPFRALISGHKI